MSQRDTLELALKVLETAPAPRTTVQSPQRWSESHRWKLDYLNIDRMPAEEIARLRAEADQAKALARTIREKALPE